MQDSNSNALTWVLGGALVLIGLFVVILLVSVNSQADSVSTSATVTNVAPTMTLALAAAGSSVPSNTTATLSAGTTKTFTASGTITDTNGVGTTFANGDLASMSATLRVDIAGCVAQDNNNCYLNDTASGGNCALGTANSTTNIDYSCTFPVQFYADSTSTGGARTSDTWVIEASVTDDSSVTGSATSINFEMGTLLSLNIPATIAYGTLAREASTTNSNNQEMTLTQYGNDGADVEVSGTTMPCSIVGTIPIANQEWSLTDLSANTVNVNDLTGSAVDTNIGISYRTNDAAALTSILYWNITIPNVASGSCTGTNTITAIAA